MSLKQFKTNTSFTTNLTGASSVQVGSTSTNQFTLSNFASNYSGITLTNNTAIDFTSYSVPTTFPYYGSTGPGPFSFTSSSVISQSYVGDYVLINGTNTGGSNYFYGYIKSIVGTTITVSVISTNGGWGVSSGYNWTISNAGTSNANVWTVGNNISTGVLSFYQSYSQNKILSLDSGSQTGLSAIYANAPIYVSKIYTPNGNSDSWNSGSSSTPTFTNVTVGSSSKVNSLNVTGSLSANSFIITTSSIIVPTTGLTNWVDPNVGIADGERRVYRFIQNANTYTITLSSIYKLPNSASSSLPFSYNTTYTDLLGVLWNSTKNAWEVILFIPGYTYA